MNYTHAELGALRAAGYDNEFISLENGIRKYVEMLDGIGEIKRIG